MRSLRSAISIPLMVKFSLQMISDGTYLLISSRQERLESTSVTKKSAVVTSAIDRPYLSPSKKMPII